MVIRVSYYTVNPYYRTRGITDTEALVSVWQSQALTEASKVRALRNSLVRLPLKLLLKPVK